MIVYPLSAGEDRTVWWLSRLILAAAVAIGLFPLVCSLGVV